MASLARFPPDRLATLTDGVFAIAMTVIALELVGAIEPDAAPHELWDAVWPRLVSYTMSFLILGLLWSGHHFEMQRLRETDRWHVWLTLAFLLVIAAIPFPAALLGTYLNEWFAVAVYGATLSLAVFVLEMGWLYARRTGLTRDDGRHAMERRLAVALGCYAVGVTVALWEPVAGIVVFAASHVALALTPMRGTTASR